MFLDSCGPAWCQVGYIYPPLLAEAFRPLALLPADSGAFVWLLSALGTAPHGLVVLLYLAVTGANLLGMVLLWLACLVVLRASRSAQAGAVTRHPAAHSPTAGLPHGAGRGNCNR